MTLLASWIGVDTHGPTSAYIVSDSRISWGTRSVFDYGKKVFASSQYPEIFGYAGDVLFPSIVLGQIVEMINCNLLFGKEASCKEKNEAIYHQLCYALSKYPDELEDRPIQILHITRDTEFEKYPNFHQYLMAWSKKDGWHRCEVLIPDKSEILHVLGSGRSEFIANYERYQQGINQSTSRNVFHCFLDTLNNIKDPFCGGAPQLVGIYRKPLTCGNNYGIIYCKKRYFLGMSVPGDSEFNNIEWRNELFELVDGKTKKRIDGAAKQPDPLRR